MTTELDALPESVREALVICDRDIPDVAGNGAQTAWGYIRAELIRLTARVQELERENGELRAALNERLSIFGQAVIRTERAEAELAAIRKRIAESATATLRITYEEDRAMGVHLRDMDIGALCWLDGECVALLPLDDEAKS